MDWRVQSLKSISREAPPRVRAAVIVSQARVRASQAPSPPTRVRAAVRVRDIGVDPSLLVASARA